MSERISYNYGTPVYVDPETGMWRASREIEREQSRLQAEAFVHKMAEEFATQETEEEKMAMASNKKASKPKKQTPVQDLNQTIQEIIRKYLVVRAGNLGPEMCIPASKVPDLIKDVAQLVNDYVASQEKKIRKDAEKANDLGNEVWDKFADAMKKIEQDKSDSWGDKAWERKVYEDEFNHYINKPDRKVRPAQPKWTEKYYMADKPRNQVEG